MLLYEKGCIMRFTFKSLHKISPNIDKAFSTFYDSLLNDMHFSNFFETQSQVDSLIEKQKIFFTQSLEMKIEDLEVAYIKLGEYHYDICIPYVDFMKGIEILEESFLIYSQSQDQSVELMTEIFRYFKFIKAQTAKGYLNKMLNEDEKDIEIFFENLTNENDELSKEIVFERLSWLQRLIHAIKYNEEFDFSAKKKEKEFKVWLETVEFKDVRKKAFIEDLEKRININTQNLFYFLKRGDFLEILPLYSSLLGIYKLTLLLSNSVSMTMTDYIVNNLKMDNLTNLYRKDAFEQFLTKELAFIKREKGFFSVVFLDVDDFKYVNDHYGHWSGDKVLEKIGEVINNNIRSSDIGFRIGGDEFAIIFKNTTKEEALNVCENIKSNINTFSFFYNDKTSFSINVSMGIYECVESEVLCDIETIVKNVDKKLYLSKERGKGLISY